MKRYAVVGVSHRALRMFIEPILTTYKEVAQIVAYLDISPERIRMMNEIKGTSIPAYTPEQFDHMVDETRPDTVIVASMDSTHDYYIIKALARDLDVWCEKPVTTDAYKARAILAAAQRSKGRVTVTFNYRYSPLATKIRELIQDGAVGRVVSADLNWYLDTYHGSSYFMRWNRKRACSGGLNVHKATHHFDLIQWWIGQKPVEVFGYGARNFYGPDGPRNPSRRDGRVCPACAERRQCEYYMRWHRDEWRGAPSGIELDEHVSGLQAFSHYKSPLARRCIYDSEIDIEDTYSAVIKYDGGATLSYSLIASAPYEGYRLGINGIDGRIDVTEIGGGPRAVLPEERPHITYIPLFGGRQVIEPLAAAGGHGGGDPALQDDLFLGPDPNEKVSRMAPLMDGILSVLTGVALHRSIVENRPVRIAELLEGEEGKTQPAVPSVSGVPGGG